MVGKCWICVSCTSNQLAMKNNFLVIFLLVFLASCDKYPDPGSEILESLSFHVYGNEQYGEGGFYLNDSIGIVFEMNSSFNKNKPFKMELEIEEGGGAIDKNVLYSDNSGRMFTRWKLGTESNNQIIQATISDSNGKYITQTTFKASAYFLNNINKITSGIIPSIGDMVTDTINHRSIIMAGYRGFYELGETFYDWRYKNSNNSPFITQIEINSKGVLYSVNQDGKLFKSADWGKSWQFVSKPIPENNYSINLCITSDDYIWVSKWDYGIYCSKDEGLTWQHDTIGLAVKEEMSRVYKLGNSHIAVSGKLTQILQTFDNGVTWKPINTPLYTHVIYVTEKDEIIACNEENGFSIYKSSDEGLTYKKVLTGNGVHGNFPFVNFGRFGPNYYMLVPSWGVYRTTDFEYFTQIMDFNVQNKLFIDYLGNIYAIGTNWANKGPDPAFVFPSGN